MSNFNKIFAAALIAGIVAMLSGFIAKQIIHHEDMDKDAVVIAGAQDTHGDSDKPKKEGIEPVLHLLAEADIARGAKLSKICAACHSFDKGGPVKQGPSLWDIVNTPKGAVAGFNYSDGMAAKGGNWDYASLNEFLAKPKNYIKDTKMTYAGMKKVDDRAAMIAWLRTLADTPAALPDAVAIAAEAETTETEDASEQDVPEETGEHTDEEKASEEQVDEEQASEEEETAKSVEETPEDAEKPEQTAPISEEKESE